MICKTLNTDNFLVEYKFILKLPLKTRNNHVKLPQISSFDFTQPTANNRPWIQSPQIYKYFNANFNDIFPNNNKNNNPLWFNCFWLTACRTQNSCEVHCKTKKTRRLGIFYIWKRFSDFFASLFAIQKYKTQAPLKKQNRLSELLWLFFVKL